MTIIKNKVWQGSSLAGIGLILNGITILISSKGASPEGWGLVATGIGAVLRD